MAASSPTVWRRWLAFELVRLRQRAGLEQKDVAKALRCSVGKVSYYETAERPVVVRDLDEVLLPLYGVPEDRWPVYLQAARDSRQKGWWERYDPATLPDWFSLFVGLEQGAARIRVYEAQLVPGLLQTHAYAEAVTRSGTAERTEEEIERHVELRLARQAVLDRDPDPLRLWVVLDEAVLRRMIGGPAVMAEQWEHVLSRVDSAGVSIRVVAFGAGVHAAEGVGFTVFDFDDDDLTPVVYAEQLSRNTFVDEADEVAVYTSALADAELMGESATASRELIAARAGNLS